MHVFGNNGKGVTMWGPTAAVDVRIPALGSVVEDSWILVGISIGAKEIVDIRQCFNDVSYIYALGNDQNRCKLSLSFVVFIGRKNCKGSENLKAIGGGLDAYISNRVSRHTDPHAITIGGFSCKGWLESIDIGNTDALRGVCTGTVQFVMQLERNGGGGSGNGSGGSGNGSGGSGKSGLGGFGSGLSSLGSSMKL